MPNMFNDNRLFERTNFEGGLPTPRDDQTVMAIHDPDIDNDTLYTVTSGKTLYITYIKWVEEGVAGGDDTIYLRDGGSAGTINFAGVGDTELNLPVPIKFTTDVYVDTVGTSEDVNITLVGWEQ